MAGSRVRQVVANLDWAERIAEIDEAQALVPTASQPSFLQAMVRDRIVAEDWLVAIDSNRYSVPFMLIGKTVQVVRQGGSWVIRHRGAVVAEHAVLAGRGQLSVLPQHGPGAAVRNARQRYATPRKVSAALDLSREVEVRDLLVGEIAAARAGDRECLDVTAVVRPGQDERALAVTRCRDVPRLRLDADHGRDGPGPRARADTGIARLVSGVATGIDRGVGGIRAQPIEVERATREGGEGEQRRERDRRRSSRARPWDDP